MGWGTDEHEGFADEKRADGSWSGGTTRSGDSDANRLPGRLLVRLALRA